MPNAMTPLERALLLRECGSVQRCHTVPHVGEYSVAAHSWAVAMLILTLHPSPSPALIRAALTHDCAERFTGDLPGPMRFAIMRIDLVENDVRRWLSVEQDSMLSTAERDWLYAADKAELLLWCDDQIAMGNQHVVHVRRSVVEWFRQHEGTVPSQIRELFRRSPDDWRRGQEYNFRTQGGTSATPTVPGVGEVT